MKMYCPEDGAVMKWEGPDADTFACLVCGMVLAYRSDPQRFEVVRDSGNTAIALNSPGKS